MPPLTNDFPLERKPMTDFKIDNLNQGYKCPVCNKDTFMCDCYEDLMNIVNERLKKQTELNKDKPMQEE